MSRRHLSGGLSDTSGNYRPETICEKPVTGRQAAADTKRGRKIMIRFAAFARAALTAAALATAAASAPAFALSADGQDRRVLIENRSSQSILFVRGSPTTDSSFGNDRIPDRTIGTGQSGIVDFDSGTSACMYDLRVTLADGSNVDRMNVNVCRVSRWTIGNRSNELR
jgi:hypothetical protein